MLGHMRGTLAIVCALLCAGCGDAFSSGEGEGGGSAATSGVTTATSTASASTTGSGGAAPQSCHAAEDCTGLSGECDFWLCVLDACELHFVDQGTLTEANYPGDCRALVCDGSGGAVYVAVSDDVEDDGNPCTKDVCDGMSPAHQNKPLDTLCSEGVCDGAGLCVECNHGSQCASGSCVESVCQ